MAMPRPMAKPIIGAMRMKRQVHRMPPHTSADQPACVNPAPTRPPINACEELVGSPKCQVKIFHGAQLPTAPPAITALLTTSGAMMPLPIVPATLRLNKRNATKLKKAAHNTACCGLNTRVDTTVAIEFAASCRPLRKSNARASAIRNNTTQGNAA